MGIDWTAVLVGLVGVVGTLLSGLLAYVCKKYVNPWLEQKGLAEVAAIVVDAVEAIVGRGSGGVKWEMALAKMEERGFNVDSDTVLDALKAAWLALDMQQIAAGAKESAM